MRSSLKKLSYLVGKTGLIKYTVLLVLMIINSILEMVGVGAIPVFIAMISSPDVILQHRWAAPVVKSLHITSSANLMILGGAVLLVLYVLKNIFYSLLIYIQTKTIFSQQVRLGNTLFQAYMKARYTFFLNHNSAELLSNVNNETRIIISDVITPLLRIIMHGLILIMIVALLLKVEPVISLLTFAVMGTFSFLFIRVTNQRNKAYGQEAQHQRQKMNVIVLEGLAGIKDVKVLGRENSFLDRYDFAAWQTTVSQRYKQIINQLPRPFMEIIAVTGMLLISMMLLVMGRQASSFIPVLTLFGVATVRLLPILRDILSAVTDVKYNMYAVDPVYNHLKQLEREANHRPEHENTTGLSPYPFSSQIVFSNVSYHYPQAGSLAIRDINLKIDKGSVIGLVGPSGAGKTTIVDILLGLLEPQHGTIAVDNQDIFENVRRWQINVGYVPQSIYLSDDTIRRNIAFGLPDDKIDEFQIRQAVHAAQLEPLIQALPKGLDTIVGEKGIRLSGGERQRIGIARALYNNPLVLIMDEATSALDNVTEKIVIESIENLRGDRTIIMIAHRLTTVRNCDVIYLINEGRILEKGRYDYLLENSGAFQKMNLMQ